MALWWTALLASLAPTRSRSLLPRCLSWLALLSQKGNVSLLERLSLLVRSDSRTAHESALCNPPLLQTGLQLHIPVI